MSTFRSLIADDERSHESTSCVTVAGLLVLPEMSVRCRRSKVDCVWLFGQPARLELEPRAQSRIERELCDALVYPESVEDPATGQGPAMPLRASRRHAAGQEVHFVRRRLHRECRLRVWRRQAGRSPLPLSARLA